MKKMLLGSFVSILLLAVIIINTNSNSKAPQNLQKTEIYPTKAVVKKSTVTPVFARIYVPYWNIPEKDSLAKFDDILFFSVSPDKFGDITNSNGYLLLQSFASKAYEAKQKTLVVAILDNNVAYSILENTAYSNTLIREVFNVTSDYEFSGVALDLEISAIPLETTKSLINNFVSKFGKEAKENNLRFEIILHGDLFARGRPYDLKYINNYVDGVQIMAYDFHKKRGEPGPNFPFDNNNKGYSFKKMIKDFESIVQKEKITVLFGMYGYDWTLGKQGLPLKPATAISLKNIQSFIKNNNCKEGIVTKTNECSIFVQTVSREKNIQFKDAEGLSHHIYYEDEESANFKTEYLKEQGISKIGYWVWGYF